ncbi:aminotransferase class I/II-fold pyridoxal phosphate-dependent enzyme [Pleionea sediminis]|uniref:aminotransferase class I/II-fold pyridoxal phosphate-dependent enzyme n=1 Tax=Pleionea sediminis TaxID=2569479 RepID=UPI001185348F|nr:pyridoxal phosphate-dependent aminotransferase family protein [Pleionea sediminis]
MSEKMKKLFAKEMTNMDAAGLLRHEINVSQSDGMQVDFGEFKAHNFIDNDFLGWRTNEELQATALDAIRKYGMGSTSSRTFIGTLDLFKSLEERLCEFLFLEDCMVFPSIYTANMSLFEPLTSERDVIFLDEMTNLTLVDSIRLSRAKAVYYKNKDDENLEYHIKCSENARFRMIVTDAVFNANGEYANLERIQEFKESYDAISVVDDSLGLGILGENGRGLFSELNLQDKQDLVTGSFANALGHVSGGFIGGDRTLINWLRQSAKPYILSEPIAPVNAAVIMKAIDILEQDVSAIEQLKSNANYLKEKIALKDWKLLFNDHPMVSIVVGSTLRAQKIVEYLFVKNILVSGLCYPNTPEGESLIRIHVSASHTTEQLDILVEYLDEAINFID